MEHSFICWPKIGGSPIGIRPTLFTLGGGWDAGLSALLGAGGNLPSVVEFGHFGRVAGAVTGGFAALICLNSRSSA